ncbi:hypothetical protein A176_000055 [Myxococcus hansupus]|uniref:Lipoprotein n=1 Tax=Pseudomyxococcus hansupus TaxID=1297742 RepID=A0A0H4WNJ6_9BACT|nr:hypothetical protein [Myxococcus hansupus]AKQ63143.1 hypothetical protein A176_000055 [Myxococcus hansupus]
MKKCLLFIGLSMTACSPTPTDTEPPSSVAPTVSKERRDALKTVFGKAFASALADSPSLRKLIKDEALTKFDNDYDVLYHLIKERPLADGQTVRELLQGYFESAEHLSDVETELPLLTIFVPELPNNSFSADAWDTDTQIPVVGITSYKTNDVTLVDAKGEQHVIPADLVPGFPVVVIKENERVIPVTKNTPDAIAKGRILQASGNLGFAFLADCFDGSRALTASASSLNPTPDPKLRDAWSIYYDTDGWQRDYIYYNISPSQTRGPFSYAYQEHIRSFRMVGDPATAFSKIADQTGAPEVAGISQGTNSGWMGGAFEFKVRVLLNAKNGLGQEYVTYFSALPGELFSLTYERYPGIPGNFGFYKPRLTGLVTKSLSLPLFAWDLDDYASTIKIEVEEVDVTETILQSESRTVKFATNFGIDTTFESKVKMGLKFGSSLEETRTESTQRTYTLGNDLLGSVIVNFADSVLTDATFMPDGNGGYVAAWMSREYSTGWYSLRVEPTRVQ